MKIRVSLTLLLCLFISTGFSQSPQSFKYQAIARDFNGNIIAEQDVGLRISILQGSASGIAVYTETHVAHTNQFGLFSINIGDGTTTNDFSAINWGNNSYFLKSEMDTAGGTSYIVMGTTQLLSVPYALYSKNTENVDDADADPSNEIQNLSQSGNDVTLSKGGGTVSVADNDDDPNNEIQNLNKTGNLVTLSNGGGDFIDEVNDADPDPVNELQNLSQTGNDVTLSHGGGTVSVADNDNDATNELQTINKSGSTVTLSKGGGSFTDAVIDADNNPANEIQTLSLTGNNLSISSGNTVGLPTASNPAGLIGYIQFNDGGSFG